MKKSTLLLLCLQCCLYSAKAQGPGTPVNSFGTDGAVTFPTLAGASRMDIVLQPDGKIVTGGNLLFRFEANGVLDPNFANNGVDTVKVNDTLFNCNSIALQPDGKILVTARPTTNYAGPNDFIVIRYNADGGLDNTFGDNGVVRTDIASGSNDKAYELTVQPDGKILVVGQSSGTLAVCRYTEDGTLDNTFDGDGIVLLHLATLDNYIKVQADGKILVGDMNILVRLEPDGSKDLGFGAGGEVWLANYMSDLAVQPDGKIVLVGENYQALRFNEDGTADNTFGVNGVASYPFGHCNNFLRKATSVNIQPDGRVVVGGFQRCGYTAPNRSFLVLRYDPDGTVDYSFGNNGRALSIQAGQSDASAITPDLKVILSGGTTAQDMTDIEGNLMKWHLGWLLDVNTGSGNDGRFTVSPNPTFDQININAVDVENGLWHITVRDITGRQLIQEDIVVTGGSINTDLSLKNLPAGIYMLHLNNGKEKTVSKVVKY